MLVRSQQVSLQFFPELNRLIEEIRTKPPEGKERASIELKSIYLKLPEFSEEIFSKLLKLINGNDTYEKLGGLIAVDQLSSVIQETQVITFVNRFLSVIFQQFTFNNDFLILRKTAEVFGKLVRMGGTKIAQVVEADVDEAFKWLKGDSVKEIRKFSSILALKQLLIEAPYLSFNRIFMNSESFSLIWNIVRDKKSYLREEALDFLDVSIKNISQRELNMQADWVTKIYGEINKTKNSSDAETIQGNIIVLRSLLSYGGQKESLWTVEQISDYIIAHRNNKNAFVQLSVIETLPILARYDIQTFCNNYLKTCLTFLLSYGLNVKGREKSVCYDTLANLYELIDKAYYEEYMAIILKNIKTELEKKTKPFCNEIIKCLECLRKKFQKKLAEYCNINQLCELILLNGLYPANLEFLGELCKMEKNDIWWNDQADYIQLKLLMTISSILAGKIYQFPHRQSLDEENISKFRVLISSEISSNSEFKGVDAISFALQALAAFDFTFYADSMALFVKDIVLEYLDNENVKIRKAAAKAGCLLYIRKSLTGQMSITKNLIGDILEKFLGVCVSDPENSVRETMLESLNQNFDLFLINQRYLKMLFTCLNDPVYKVQENSLKIICRLMQYNPAEIIPFLKKRILQILSGLNYELIYKEKEKTEILDLLTCMITCAPKIIAPHTDTICITMINMLNDPNVSNTLIPHILDVLSNLSFVVKEQILSYLKDLFPIIIQCMQDMSYSQKREKSIKTMIQIIKNTGYVILPYYKYPNLLDTILYLIKNESNVGIRRELLRLIGALGALDAFYYKRIHLRLADNQTGLSIDEILQQDFKTPFTITLKLQEANKKANLSKVELIKFFSDLIIVNDIDKKKSTNSLNLFQLQTILDAQLKAEERAYNEKYIQNAYSQNPEIDELLYSHTVINLSNPEYYATVTIKALLKVLADPTLNQFHNLAVDALNFILNTLKARFANFLYLVIPVFTHLFQMDASLRELLLHQLDKILKLCGSNFQEQYVEPVLNLALNYMTDPNIKIQKCFETLLTLVKTSKRFLRHKMDLITTKLNQVIRSCEDSREVIYWVLSIYYCLGEMLDNHLDNIISLLTKIITNYSLTDPESLSNIVNFFYEIIHCCPSTLQYTSKLVQCLIFLIDFAPGLRNQVVDCFVKMIRKFKNSFMTYLPLVNSYIIKHKIVHRDFRICIDVLLNHGSLQEIETFLEPEPPRNEPSITGRDSYRIQKMNIDSLQSFPIRPTDNEALLAEFKTSHRNLKEEWIEWMRKSSLELLKQNPYPVLYGCNSVAELYPPIAKELYNIAFVSCWSILNDKQKETMVKYLNHAITHPTIPINILQTILNLAEFMQHDREVIPIDISVLGGLAERCLAYAKALYYRELEFEVSPESTIESLISLYTNLGHSEAANGLLIYAKNTLNIELKMSWYENLQRWQEALNAYNLKSADSTEDYFVNKMRCLNAMSDWDALIKQCDSVIDSVHEDNAEKRRQVIDLAANAALNLSEWDTLEKYTDRMDENNENKNFLQAIISIRKNKLDVAKYFIAKCRDSLDTKVSGLLLESYSRAYDNVIRLQQLVEMEEIIDYKLEENKLLMETELIKEYPSEKLTAKIEELKSKNEVSKIASIQTLKQNLIQKWNDRLNGCQSSIDVWQKILSVRSILLSKYENLDSWVKLSNMCLKQGQASVSERTLAIVKQEVSKVIPNEKDMPPQLVLASLDCNFATGTLGTEDYMNKIGNYLDSIDSSDELKSKYYIKLGRILKKEREETSEESIQEILSYYEKACKHNKDNYKAWHHLGLMNFEAVEYYSNLNEKSYKKAIHTHVIASLKGLIKAISLGSSTMANSKSLQDTLRVLTLWFKYGDHPETEKILQDSFKTIDLVSWIQVVPQLIARFDIPNVTIQNLIHELLILIGRNHPQALIYPLTVSLKEKMSARKMAASKILEDMKKHFPEIVKQVLLISDELVRTAILLKEQWCDGIEEACRLYFQEKNVQGMIKTLMDLHDSMKVEPQTLSEITFHQGFKLELSEAEAWLRRYITYKDEYCLAQAWDTYQSIFKKITEKLQSLSVVYLENVSPKLLNTKNTDISVPGLYDPKRPLIKIAGFCPNLSVLTSKQHPRKLTIYGSDGKDYTFLLKGHEDTRQDERVMQLFSLVNQLLATETETKMKDLSIMRYSITPLSTRAGLLGWVQKCDTLQQLIREYRENFKIIPNTENKLLGQMCLNADYEKLPLANKVEIFRHVLENTKGEDLKKVLWLKSPNSETWLERRTNYTRSLATMSMVGYILGLGDRHPSNIMLQRMTGKIVHIDFGDCFEVAMKREKFPERVPFRLTRMLVKVMEACSIEGTYRSTCEDVMRVLRDNKDSLMAVLQAFVYDPLLNWRLLTASDAKQEVQHHQQENKSSTFVNLAMNNVGGMFNIPEQKRNKKNIIDELEELKEQAAGSPKRKEEGREKEIQKHVLEDENNRPIEILNQRALEVVERIKKKLNGRDFKETEVLGVKEQVNQLIRQATSHENICQAYIGWCPFW